MVKVQTAGQIRANQEQSGLAPLDNLDLEADPVRHPVCMILWIP